MKTKQIIGILFATLAILSSCTNNRGVVEHPAFIARNSTLEIDKVELSDTATVLYIKAFYPPGSGIKPDPNSFLIDDFGKKYPLLSTEGISMDKEFYMPDSGETEFTLIFSPVASNATFVDYSEGDYGSAWKIWGIQLTNRQIKVNMPEGFKDVVVDKNAVLPPVEFKEGKARIEGQILNYRKGMPEEMPVFVDSPIASNRISLSIDSTGKFSGEIDAFTVHPATIYCMNSGIKCFIAPGDTTLLILNPSSRKSLHNEGDNSSMGEPVYYGGYLASLSKELANLKPGFYRNLDSYESYMSFIKSIGTKTPEELKTFLLDEYQAKKAVIDTLNVSPACKQYLHCASDLFYADAILNITSLIDRAYIINNHLQNDMEAVNKYYASRKFNLPDDFNDAVKNFPLINSPQILYVQGAAGDVNQWQTQNKQPILIKALGTDQGTLFDMMRTVGAYNDIKNFKPASNTLIEQLPVAYQGLIKNKNDELLKLLAANKGKTNFKETDITKVANEDVFPFILSKFRGKPILLDFWATWCGPCRQANEELKSIKEELAKKGIVFVYVAGENSPLNDWKKMTADLHGEHFRLTAEQWDYVGKTFE